MKRDDCKVGQAVRAVRVGDWGADNRGVVESIEPVDKKKRTYVRVVMDGRPEGMRNAKGKLEAPRFDVELLEAVEA